MVHVLLHGTILCILCFWYSNLPVVLVAFAHVWVANYSMLEKLSCFTCTYYKSRLLFRIHVDLTYARKQLPCWSIDCFLPRVMYMCICVLFQTYSWPRFEIGRIYTCTQLQHDTELKRNATHSCIAASQLVCSQFKISWFTAGYTT